MHLRFYITHTYIGDLEIWIGCKDDSSGTYTEYKIWDRQGGSADNLGFSVILQGFQNVHDWRFRVVDSAGGDEGYVEEFYILVG